MEVPQNLIFMIFGSLEPLGTFICEFEYTKVLSEIQDKSKIIFENIVFGSLEFVNLRNLKFWNLRILESWKLGILELRNLEALNLVNFVIFETSEALKL